MKLCLRCNQYFEDDTDTCPNDKSSLESVGKDPIIGMLINDRYAVDSVIGKGSSGIVYKAARLMMAGEYVALKVIHSYLGADNASLDRLIRELRAAERLRHPHIIRLWESGTTDDGQPYLVMDYVEGNTLNKIIENEGCLSPARILDITKQICEALAHAHAQGLIHRDMKPENVILEYGGSGDYVKVLDFGIADTPHDSAQRSMYQKPKTVAGSPAYMSPEQCQGQELDFRSDLYSVGVMVFEMLTGRRPFRAPGLSQLMYKAVTEPAPALSEVRKDLYFPPEVEDVVARALAKTAEERQNSVMDLWRELEVAFAGKNFGKGVPPAKSPNPPRVPPGRDPNIRRGPDDSPTVSQSKGRDGASMVDDVERGKGARSDDPTQSQDGSEKRGAPPPPPGRGTPKGGPPPAPGRPGKDASPRTTLSALVKLPSSYDQDSLTREPTADNEFPPPMQTGDQRKLERPTGEGRPPGGPRPTGENRPPGARPPENRGGPPPQGGRPQQGGPGPGRPENRPPGQRPPGPGGPGGPGGGQGGSGGGQGGPRPTGEPRAQGPGGPRPAGAPGPGGPRPSGEARAPGPGGPRPSGEARGPGPGGPRPGGPRPSSSEARGPGPGGPRPSGEVRGPGPGGPGGQRPAGPGGPGGPGRSPENRPGPPQGGPRPTGPGGPGPGGRPPENRTGQPQVGPRPGGPGGQGGPSGPGSGGPGGQGPGGPGGRPAGGQGPRPGGPGGPGPGNRPAENRPGQPGQRPSGPSGPSGQSGQRQPGPQGGPQQQGPRTATPERPSRPSQESRVPQGPVGGPAKAVAGTDYKTGTDYQTGIAYQPGDELDDDLSNVSFAEPQNSEGEHIRPYPTGVAYVGPATRTGEQPRPSRRFESDLEDPDLSGRQEGPAFMGGKKPPVDEPFTMPMPDSAPPGFNDDPLLSGSTSFERSENESGGGGKSEPLGRPRVTFDSPRISGSRALGALLDSMDTDEEEEEEDDSVNNNNKFADQLASSTGISVVKSKTKESDAAKLIESLMGEPSPKASINKQPTAMNEVADGVSDALDRLLDEKSVERKLTAFPSLSDPISKNKRVEEEGEEEDEEDSSDLASQIDKWLDEAADETPGPVDDLDELIPKPSPTSTQDALSRLLEAASKAPDKPGGEEKKSRSSAQNMASMVNKPPMKISRQFAKLQESDIMDAAKKPSVFDDEPKVFEGGGPSRFGRSAGPTNIDLVNPDSIPSSFESAGTGSTIDQDAVNARIAALQKKMEEQSKSNISLDQLPDAPPPEPSILPDNSNRRDVVNRIMEEAANRKYQEPSGPSERMEPVQQENVSVQELERLSTSRLQQMAEMEAKGRQTRQQMRSKSMGPSIDPGKIIAIVAVIAVGVAGIFFREPILKMVAGGNSGDVARDTQVLAKVDELEKSGKLADAMKYLESEEKDRELTQELWDRLDAIYFKLAKYYYEKAGQQQVAISLLETKINSQSPRFGEAQKLIQEYKKPKKQGKQAGRKKRRKR